MKNILWNPPEPGKTKMAQFMYRVNQVYGLDMNSYDELFNWSVNHIPDFWGQIWDYAEIKLLLIQISQKKMMLVLNLNLILTIGIKFNIKKIWN